MNAGVLDGAYAPVHEEVTATELEVTGTIPEHLDGRYVRIGPNPLNDPDPATYHLFAGDGMVHGVRLRGGRAEWYRNRWIRTAEISRALGERPRPGRIHAGLDTSVNTNVISHDKRTFALVEAGIRPYELTDELETVGPCDFDGTLPGGFTAHPHRDPATGELHAVSYFFGWGNRVQYSVITAGGRVRRTVDVEVTGSPMIHDFSLTEDYVIIYDLPVTFDPDMMVKAMPRWLARPARSLLSRVVGHLPIPEPVVSLALRANPRTSVQELGLPYSWNPRHPARIGVLPRDGGPRDVRWYEIEPCYVFHPLNAYQDGDSLVIDVVRHPKMFATSTVPGEGVPTLDRWTIDLTSGKVGADRLDERPQEFPRHDERLLGRPHRYGYTVGMDRPPEAGPDKVSILDFGPDALFKHDVVKGSTETHRFGPGRTAGEFVFVPRAEDAEEDEGVLLGYVHDHGRGRSDLVLLDARSLDTVGTVHLPVRVPAGFHGNWMPA